MKKVYIIAEAEINHNGEVDIAKKMIEIAKAVGADCIKFQYIIADEIADASSPYYKIFKKVELSQKEISMLKNFAIDSNIDFMITVPGIKSFYLAKEIGITRMKIGSSNITNTLLLREIAGFKNELDIYPSTGMSTISDIENALQTLNYKECDSNFYLFHCTSNYPATYENLNLNAITTLKNLYRNIKIGFSDHTTDSLAAIASAALGASFIEKHFTLDKNMNGPDHSFSQDPDELGKYILEIRNTEISLGSFAKKPSNSELEMINKTRKFLVTAQDIIKGEKLTYKMFDTKRISNPEDAFEANSIYLLTKLISPKDYKAGDLIRLSDLNK